MTFKFRYADRIVGIFVLVALLFVLFMVIVAGVNRQWFAHQYSYESLFTTADGLSVGKAIKFKGVEVGTIKSYKLNDENNIDVSFVIYEEYINKLKPNSVLELSTNPLGIGGGLTLYPGNNDRPYPEEGSFIPSTQFQEALDLIDQGLVITDGKGDVVGDLMTHVDDTVVSINDLITTINRSLEGDLDAGPIGGILWEVNDIAARADQLVSHLTNLMMEIEHADELVPTLVGNEGVIGGFISDEADFYLQVVEMTDEIGLTLENITSLTGALSSSTPEIDQILKNLSATLERAEDVMEGISNNPLLRGGINENVELPTSGGASLRDEEF